MRVRDGDYKARQRTLSVVVHHPAGKKSEIINWFRKSKMPSRAMRSYGIVLTKFWECCESVENHECFAVAGITAKVSSDPISTE